MPLPTRLFWSVLMTATLLRGAQVVYEKNLSSDLLAVDAAGNAYAASGGSVTKLAPDGTVLYSKPVLLPGSTWFAIAVDAAGGVAIVGTTADDHLPTTPGVFQPQRNRAGICISGDREAKQVPCPDAFLAKLDADGNLASVSYLGGSLQDQANAVALDSGGNLYVAGFTQSSDFPNVSSSNPQSGVLPMPSSSRSPPMAAKSFMRVSRAGQAPILPTPWR